MKDETLEIGGIVIDLKSGVLRIGDVVARVSLVY